MQQGQQQAQATTITNPFINLKYRVQAEHKSTALESGMTNNMTKAFVWMFILQITSMILIPEWVSEL